ncbi:MAG: glucose-1-phosphate adenylyltransferase subunit GlgD [Lachnospiraceae bacterium]|nr:glucose-1-phosphate adenylyltransferase subunit GlgD [Lachnospiraceae bacterium]
MKALGIILAGGNSKRMKELTQKRAIAAMPVAGSFRAIDFALSNMSHSQIGTVAVIAQYSSRSLSVHLNSSKWWDFGRKQGGLFLFNPTITPENNNWYRGTADAIAQNLDFLYQRHEPYVVITSGDGIYKMDYNDAIAFHTEHEADITVVCKDMTGLSDVSRFGVVRTDEEGRILDFEEKPIATELNTVSCGVYIIRRRLLISLMEQCKEMEWYDFVRDALIRQKNVKKIMAYRLDSYWNNISTVKAYYDVNMEFLKPEMQKHFFRDYPAVQTKVDDYAPAKFNPGSKVTNSLVANGAILNGEVQNSILGTKVFVGKNCSVKDSIILSDAYISDSVVLENCIVESRVNIPEGTVYRGTPEAPCVVSQ